MMGKTAPSSPLNCQDEEHSWKYKRLVCMMNRYAELAVWHGSYFAIMEQIYKNN